MTAKDEKNWLLMLKTIQWEGVKDMLGSANADNQRLRDVIASYHDHHKQWEEYCYKCNPQG